MKNCLVCNNEFRFTPGGNREYVCSKPCMYIGRKTGAIGHGGFKRGTMLSGKFKKGKDHWNWQGGISGSRDRKNTQYKCWRLGVFERDNYTCQDCGEKESVAGLLEAHHIKAWALYSELRYELDNGLTLCKVCHAKTTGYKVKNIASVYQSI